MRSMDQFGFKPGNLKLIKNQSILTDLYFQSILEICIANKRITKMTYFMLKILFFSTLLSPLLGLSINKRAPCEFSPPCCPEIPCVDSEQTDCSNSYNQASLQNHQSQCCDDQQHEVQCCNSQ